MRIQPSRISWWLFFDLNERKKYSRKSLTMVIVKRIILIVLGKR